MKAIKSTALFVVVIFLLVGQSVFSQLWIKTHDGPSHLDDKTLAIASDKAGNLYVTGYTTTLIGGCDMILKKYNASGVEQWTRTYNGPGNNDDKAWGIVVDRNDNIIITGYSTGVGSGKDFTTIKYNSSGSLLWVSRYNEPGNGDDRAFGIVVDRIGNVYVTGYIARIGTDVYTIKYNSSGVYVWGQLINGTANGDDGAFGIVVDSIGNNIFICGNLNNDTTGSDFMIANYDSTGNRRWLRSLTGQGESEDKAWGIVVDGDEHIIATGYGSDSANGTDFLTARYDFSGTMLWTARYNGTGETDDKAFGIVVDSEGNSFVSGYSTGANTGTDFMTIKYKPSGDTGWTARYDGAGSYQDTALALYISKNENFLYVTGCSSADTVNGKLDVLTVKYDTKNGGKLQHAIYDGAAHKDDAGTCITADTSRNIFIGGYTTTLTNGTDMLAFKYLNGEIIALETISSIVPQNFKLYQNYPNPFNPVTRILFDLSMYSSVKLTIYDMLGREVKILVNEDLKAGTYEVTFSPLNLASGIYFYELNSDGHKETKKMMLIK